MFRPKFFILSLIFFLAVISSLFLTNKVYAAYGTCDMSHDIAGQGYQECYNQKWCSVGIDQTLDESQDRWCFFYCTDRWEYQHDDCWNGQWCNWDHNVCSGQDRYQGCVTVPGKCGVPSCAANVDCSTLSCHTGNQTVADGSCGTKTCSSNAPTAGTIPVCRTSAGSVPNGSCGTTNYSANCNTSCSGNTCVAAPTATAAPTVTGTPAPGSVNCWVCDQCKWRGPYQRSGTSCQADEYISGGPSGTTCSTGCTNPTSTPTGTTTPTGTPPAPALFTSEYRCSEVRFNKNDSSSPAPAWVPYQNEDFSGEPIKFKYTFTSNVTQGNDLTLFCQFKSDSGTTSQVYQKSIKYIGGDPKITNITCSWDPSGTGTQVIVKGLNLGTHSDQANGNMKIASKDSVISYWGKDTTPVSTDSAQINSSASAGLKDEVIAKISDKLSAGKIPIILTTDDNRSTTGYCNFGTTTIDFKLKTTCGINIKDLSLDNVSVDITEKVDKAKPVIKKKITVDKEGKPQSFIPDLEIGKKYVLSINGPKSLNKKVEFTANEGTTTLDDIILPIGDIYPISSPDNKINAFDKSEMSREWSLVSDVSRPADLNNDLRVNSIDYSCLLNNYNKNGD